jgi:hypothetical protein
VHSNSTPATGLSNPHPTLAVHSSWLATTQGGVGGVGGAAAVGGGSDPVLASRHTSRASRGVELQWDDAPIGIDESRRGGGGVSFLASRLTSKLSSWMDDKANNTNNDIGGREAPRLTSRLTSANRSLTRIVEPTVYAPANHPANDEVEPEFVRVSKAIRQSSNGDSYEYPSDDNESDDAATAWLVSSAVPRAGDRARAGKEARAMSPPMTSHSLGSTAEPATMAKAKIDGCGIGASTA